MWTITVEGTRQAEGQYKAVQPEGKGFQEDTRLDWMQMDGEGRGGDSQAWKWKEEQ